MEKAHGRLTRRTLKVLQAPTGLGFPGAAQIVHRRWVASRAGKATTEIVYLITSVTLPEGSAARIAAWTRGHCGVENRLHWVRDVTLDEDRSQIRTASAPT